MISWVSRRRRWCRGEFGVHGCGAEVLPLFEGVGVDDAPAAVGDEAAEVEPLGGFGAPVAVLEDAEGLVGVLEVDGALETKVEKALDQVLQIGQ